MRPILIAGNWKMNTRYAEAQQLAHGVLREHEHLEHITTVLCPPAIWLGMIAEDVIPKNSFPHLKLGAQNVHTEPSGAFTGEISADMVKDVAEYVILGHSERVQFFHETPEIVAEKVAAALEAGLIPIICVGELEQSSHSVTQVVHRLNHIIKNLSQKDIEKIVVAYEPVWAIGTGVAATPEYAEKVLHALRGVLSQKTQILYGGSVNDKNADGFLALPDCDGLLVGGASLKLSNFISICQAADDRAVSRGHIPHHKRSLS